MKCSLYEKNKKGCPIEIESVVVMLRELQEG